MSEKNKEYFIDMVFKHIAIIYKICNLYAKDGEKDDLKQEIIYQLWKSFPSYKGTAKFQTWMYRVALNTALLELRAKKIKYTELTENEFNKQYESYDNSDKKIKVQLNKNFNHKKAFKIVPLLYFIFGIINIIGFANINPKKRKWYH